MAAPEEAEIYWPARGQALREFIRWIRWGFKPAPHMVCVDGRKHIVGRFIERGPTVAIYRGRKLAAWWKIEGGFIGMFAGTHDPRQPYASADDEIILSDGGIYKVTSARASDPVRSDDALTERLAA